MAVGASGNKATQCGTLSSGARVEAHSKQGSVIVQLSEADGIDRARIYFDLNPLTNKGRKRLLYDGPVDGSGSFAGEPGEITGVITFPSHAMRRTIAAFPSEEIKEPA
jgi:hypothetical protein